MVKNFSKSEVSRTQFSDLVSMNIDYGKTDCEKELICVEVYYFPIH